MRDGDVPGEHGAHDDRSLARRTAVVGTVVVVLALLTALVLVAAEVLLLIFAGLLFAVLLSAAADWLAGNGRIGRGTALTLILMLLTACAVAATMWLWPALSEQIDELATQLPRAVRELRGWIEQRAWGQWLLGNSDAQQMVQDTEVVGRATDALMSAIAGITALIVILFIGVYVAAQPDVYHRGLRRLIPPPRRERVDAVLTEVTSVLRWWLVGKLLEMALVGVLTTLALWWLEVPLALIFGLLAAALTFIPNFGPVIAVIPPALLTLVDQPERTLTVIGVYLAIQLVESYAITPLVQHRTVHMPPALTIAAQIVFGLLVGPIGLAVATPLVAAGMTVVRMLYVEDLVERTRPMAIPDRVS